jgi:hypothetical protein
MKESMEMEETLMNKNENMILKNGLLELKEHNNRLYIFIFIFYIVSNFFGLELCLFWVMVLKLDVFLL